MFLEAATEPLFHSLGQGAAALTGSRAIRRSCTPPITRRSARKDRQDSSGEHHQETENADDWDPDQAVWEYDTSDKE
jgi:hypothetical protein